MGMAIGMGSWNPAWLQRGPRHLFVHFSGPIRACSEQAAAPNGPTTAAVARALPHPAHAGHCLPADWPHLQPHNNRHRHHPPCHSRLPPPGRSAAGSGTC